MKCWNDSNKGISFIQVNRCIVQLSSKAENNATDPASLWGGGKDLILELDERTLKLVDPDPPCSSGQMDNNRQVLNSQPIHTIRVWGVGRDNGKDFAYVARDKHTRKVWM